MEAPQPPSDAELIARVRSGDLEAYGELFSRHHHAAERMARQLVPAADADDLAGDAFAKVLEALRAGGGPDLSFRGYLLTTVRRVHVNRIRLARRTQTTDDPAAYEREPESFDDPTVTGFESGAAAKAFASLPERWQAVLWHTEVEGEKPAAVAPLLGLTPNGVSALAYRAREGLRQAFLQQHLADVAGDRCRWVTERLGAYVRNGLTRREDKHLREHLDECAKCTAVYLELVEVNSALPALLAPVLLGAAASGYLAAAGVKAGGLGFVGVLWGKVTASPRNAATSAATVVAAVVAGMLIALQLTGGDGSSPPAAIGSEPSTTTQQPTQPPAEPPTQPPPTQPPPTQPRQSTQTSRPSQPEKSEPTTVPSATPTAPTTPSPTPTRPSPSPSPTPTASPTPTPTGRVASEGLLTISGGRSRGNGGGAPAYATPSPGPARGPAGTHERIITITPAAGNTDPVRVTIRYGASLAWSTGAGGWACVRNDSARTATCTAASATRPAPLPVSFVVAGGPAGDRTYSVSAVAGRLYDDDTETLAGRTGEPRADGQQGSCARSTSPAC